MKNTTLSRLTDAAVLLLVLYILFGS